MEKNKDNMSDDFKDINEPNKNKKYIIVVILYIVVIILTVLLVLGLKHQKKVILDNKSNIGVKYEKSK